MYHLYNYLLALLNYSCISFFSLHNKNRGLFLADMKNTFTSDTGKTFAKAKKFTLILWWRMYNNMGNSQKFNYIGICVINCGISGHSSRDSC